MPLNRSIPLAIFLTSMVGATAALATPVVTTINDNVWIDPFRTGCAGNNCDASGSPSFTDHLGANYDTTKIVVSRDGANGMTISLTTTKAAFAYKGGTKTSSPTAQGRYDGSIPYADLAIAVLAPGEAVSNTGAGGGMNDFDYGVELKRSGSNSNGINQGTYNSGWYNYYSNTGTGTANIFEDLSTSGPDMWTSAQEAYGLAGGNSGTYGGRFRDAACGALDTNCGGAAYDTYVDMNSNANDTGRDANVTYTDYDSGINAGTTVIDIKFDLTDLLRMGLVTVIEGVVYYSDFELFWGTAWCDNDAIWGVIVGDDLPPPAEVPEPGTLALFGLGLAGLAVARRRRKAA